MTLSDRVDFFMPSRFLMVPRPTLQKELNKEEKDLGDDINALNKKV